MSLPVIRADGLPIGLKAKSQENGRWPMRLSDIAVLAFGVHSSGNATPLVRVEVEWGDGNREGTDFRPIGRQYQYQHAYEEPGDYLITVVAINTEEERSVINTTRIRIVEDRGSVVAPVFRWVGLALPNGSVAQTVSQVMNDAPAEIVTLIHPATVGSQTIVVDNRSEVFLDGSQVVITQPGRLLTFARVFRREENSITLDGALNDSYDAFQASVEVQPRSSVSTFTRKQSSDFAWAFPKSFDVDLVKSAVRMVLGTQLFERVMLPEYGSDLHKIPFQQNDILVESLVRRATIEAVQKWEPRAEVQQFNITRQDNDVLVQMVVGLSNDPTAAFDINFSLNGQ